jgi:hypothetical protein
LKFVPQSWSQKALDAIRAPFLLVSRRIENVVSSSGQRMRDIVESEAKAVFVKERGAATLSHASR